MPSLPRPKRRWVQALQGVAYGHGHCKSKRIFKSRAPDSSISVTEVTVSRQQSLRSVRQSRLGDRENRSR